MEPQIKNVSWPKEFEKNPKDYIKGNSGFTKGIVEKFRDSTDRVLAVLEDAANMVDGVLHEMDRLVRRIEAKKNKHQWTQLKYNGFSDKVDNLESKYNKNGSDMLNEFTRLGP